MRDRKSNGTSGPGKLSVNGQVKRSGLHAFSLFLVLFLSSALAPRSAQAQTAIVGVNVVCVTDHDTMTDLGRATELGARLGVDVVRGEEVTTTFPPGIHIVGLFLEHQVRMHMSVEDTVDAMHDAGGLAVIAHPFMPTWFASMTPGRARALPYPWASCTSPKLWNPKPTTSG